jgi:hypothetical protein
MQALIGFIMYLSTLFVIPLKKQIAPRALPPTCKEKPHERADVHSPTGLLGFSVANGLG